MEKQHFLKLELVELQPQSYHIFVRIKIEGKLCRFLVDTGASKTCIDKSFFEKKIGRKVNVHKQETSGLHSTQFESYTVKIKEWQMGKITIKKVDMPAVDLTHVNTTYKKINAKPIQGILGSDTLLDYKIIIDYSRLELRYREL